jgi:copper(I)-binding protein
MKSAILASVALAMSSIALTACQEEAKEEAAPEGMPGVSVANARLVLPAVKGNPGAVYFDVTYSGTDYATLRKVEVAGAKDAMMHDTITQNGVTQMAPAPFVNLPKGGTVKFEPGGKHVMAMDLDPTLAAGGTTEVTLTFAGGDKTTVDAQIQPAGSN